MKRSILRICNTTNAYSNASEFNFNFNDPAYFNFNVPTSSTVSALTSSKISTSATAAKCDDDDRLATGFIFSKFSLLLFVISD
ncbi:unnamed protein product [Protopolystoma xenopodis]|uniref:Uncharacterized protein n=1 Tax=Protopolystoma xenopodis TaxID=117903 RepID=A0A448X7D3_9PLAT|nr:unnamed protein product [Protopolystoma xenopodis]